jgi:serine palmitoyltransferase
MLLGSCAIGLNSCGGFCAGSRIVVEHQRINGSSFVFSASMPGLLAVSASEGINIIRSTPSIFENLQANVYVARSILDKLDCITIPSHPASPVIHTYVRRSHPVQPSAHGSIKYNIAFASPQDTVQMAEYDAEERLLQEVVEECLAQGVMVTRAKRLKGQEGVEPRPSIRLALSSALTRKETERAVTILKNVFVKVLGRRR